MHAGHLNFTSKMDAGHLNFTSKMYDYRLILRWNLNDLASIFEVKFKWPACIFEVKFYSWFWIQRWKDIKIGAVLRCNKKWCSSEIRWPEKMKIRWHRCKTVRWKLNEFRWICLLGLKICKKKSMILCANYLPVSFLGFNVSYVNLSFFGYPFALERRAESWKKTLSYV